MELFGKDDDRVLELRRQIALLLYGSGRADEAVRQLQDLADDLARLYGSDHSSVRDVQKIIDRMQSH